MIPVYFTSAVKTIFVNHPYFLPTPILNLDEKRITW